jgi:hypothetical protein
VHARGGYGLTGASTDEMFPPLGRDMLTGPCWSSKALPPRTTTIGAWFLPRRPARAQHRHLRRDAGCGVR